MSSLFTDLLARHGIALAHPRGMVRCIFHQDRTPSLSIDAERGVFHCFGCGRQGGVKDFAVAVGEAWKPRQQYTAKDRAHFALQARRQEAEKCAQTLIQKRRDRKETLLWSAWGEAADRADEAVALLALFHRHPTLADEFPDLVATTAQEYGDALFAKMIAEQQVAGEVVL